MPKTILVTAANGTVGQHLVPRLLATGCKVRSASRSGQSKIGDSARLDFTNPATFGGALEGVDAVYLVVPTGPDHPLHLLADFVDAAASLKIKLVLQSAIGVEADETIPFRQLERKIEASASPYVLLRPNWFFDNFHTYWLKAIREHGVLELPAGDARTSFVDARDIADVAVVALATPTLDKRALTLTGQQSLTYAEVASVLSAVIGRTVRYQSVPAADFIANANKTGISPEYARHLAPIFYPVEQGWVGADSGHVAEVTRRSARTIVDYIADNADRFI